MSTDSYPASYKKEPGVIEIGSKLFIWKPANAGSSKPSIKIQLDTVAQLQATPPKSEKLQLKIACTVEGASAGAGAGAGTDASAPAGATQSYQFAFKERSVLENTKNNLQKLIQAIRSAAENSAKNGSTSTSVKADSKQAIVDLDSKKLLLNFPLQQALLKENKDLARTFQDTVIEGGLANDKFWNTRINLLRAYALTSSQKRGAYNVLGTIRPTTTSDNKINVSLTREKIHDIFEQYPIVRQAYSDNVPSKMDEGSFWERFFLSRLYRRLRGEKVPTSHTVDSILDTKYLTLYEDELEGYNSGILGEKRKRSAVDGADGAGSSSSSGASSDIYHKIVPQYLDIDGNEQDDSEKLGNLPDITMQPGKDLSSISLIRSVNSLSQRMLYGNSLPNIKNKEAEQEALEEQVKFDDLQGNSVNDLNLELHLINENGEKEKSINNIVNDINYEDVKEKYIHSLDNQLDLNHVGTNTQAIKSTVKQISTIIKLRSKESDQVDITWSDNDKDKKLLDEVQLCHATSIEFLRHFWLNFQSGDANQASAIAKLATNLTTSLERIEAVCTAPETAEAKTNARNSLSSLKVSIQTALEKYASALKAAEDG